MLSHGIVVVIKFCVNGVYHEVFIFSADGLGVPLIPVKLIFEQRAG